MEDNSIVSPPYPSDAASSLILYRTLIQFRQWLKEQQDAIKPQLEDIVTDAPSMKAVEAIRASIDSLVEPDNVPNESVWDIVGVMDKFVTLQQLQQCREIFDFLLRRYETLWQTKPAIRGRYDLIMFGHHILKEAFVDPETREARQQATLRKYMKQVKALRKHLSKMVGEDEDPKQKNKVTPDDWEALDSDPDAEPEPPEEL